MLHAPKIPDDLKILTDEEVKDFAVTNFSECFKPTKEALYFKLVEEKKLNRC